MSKLKVYRVIYVVAVACEVALAVDAVMNWDTQRAEFRRCVVFITLGTFAYYYLKGKLLRESVE